MPHVDLPRQPGESDRHWGVRRLERAWRDVIPLIALGLAGWAVAGSAGDASDAKQIAISQQEGRRVAVDVLCGGFFGVETGGRRALLGTLVPQAPPPRAERRVRRRAADAYTRIISTAVTASAGVDAKMVLKDDGTVDCVRLRAAARTSPTPTATPDG